MKTTRLFHLVQPARKSGGDKYEVRDPENWSYNFSVYVPQKISRPAGTVVQDLEITFDDLQRNN